MKPVPVLAVALMALAAASAQDEPAQLLQLPERPRGHVYDPGGWLGQLDVGALEERLAALQREDKIDIMVVVLESPPPVRPDVFARQLLDRWGKGDGQTLIMQVAGDPEGPWLVGGGRMLRLAGELTAREALLEAKQRIEASGDERQQILTAVDEMEDLLRFLSYRGRYHEERLRAVSISHRLDEMQRQIKGRILIIACAVGGGLLALGGILLVIYWSHSRAPLWFPATSWRLRFGAPYAGGSDAVWRLQGRERRNSLAQQGGDEG